MAGNRHFGAICLIAVLVSLAITVLVMRAADTDPSAPRAMGYEDLLFAQDTVHTVELRVDNWDSFLETCENEEYTLCDAVIDGEKFSGVGIRAKGNTSLSSVSAMGSRRYSFKLEFDQYQDGITYHGLDKLCLNNLIQDNTMMKDYISYRLMAEFGADTPLCSFVYITVNGEDWGLYLAVEGVEDSFLQRNYGTDTGDLYKPDSMSFGGGRGNGRDFNMDDLDFGDGRMPDMSQMPQMGGNGGMPGGFGGFGMGSDDVRLKYIDDDPDSYSNIFGSAKTEVTRADKERLIASLKNLSEYNDLENTLDMEEVLRYFVVHNFVVNGDSYTGSIIHNYYLHEKDGRLAMIPWDYNLGFGTFRGNNASESVNTSIDNPVDGDMNDRPMIGWIFSNEEYTARYHELFAQFISEWIDSGRLAQMIEDTAAMLCPYVERDPTKFCTLEEYDSGAAAITMFVQMRGEAVARQLSGDDTPVDTTGLTISDMGSMGGGMGGPGGGMSFGGRGEIPEEPGEEEPADAETSAAQTAGDGEKPAGLPEGAPQGEKPVSAPQTQKPASAPQEQKPDTAAQVQVPAETAGTEYAESPDIDAAVSAGRPPEGSDGSMTPPEGFDGTMTTPGGFDGSMTPPEGFDGTMKPPEGFDGSMTPPEGFDGSMTPPEGFGSSMTPPEGCESAATPPEDIDAAAVPAEDTGSTPQESEPAPESAPNPAPAPQAQAPAGSHTPDQSAPAQSAPSGAPQRQAPAGFGGAPNGQPPEGFSGAPGSRPGMDGENAPDDQPPETDDAAAEDAEQSGTEGGAPADEQRPDIDSGRPAGPPGDMNFPGGAQSGASAAQAGIMIGVSVVILAAGIIITIRFRRR